MKEALLNREIGETYRRIEKLEVTEKQMMISLQNTFKLQSQIQSFQEQGNLKPETINQTLQTINPDYKAEWKY